MVPLLFEKKTRKAGSSSTSHIGNLESFIDTQLVSACSFFILLTVPLLGKLGIQMLSTHIHQLPVFQKCYV